MVDSNDVLSSQELARDRLEHKRVINRFFDGRRLKNFPSKRKSQMEVLLEIVGWFSPGASYTEVEVNAILREAHDDVANLRRAMIDHGYMQREDGIYRLPTTPPQRAEHAIRESPEWERVWLPLFLAGEIDAS